jgi:integrase
MKNLKFFLRKQGKSDPVIVMQVFDARFEGRKFMYSTGHHIDPGKWDKKRERARDSKSMNDFLEHLVSQVKAFMDQRLQSKTLTRKSLKEHLINSLRDDQEFQLTGEVNEIWSTWEEIINTTRTSTGKAITPLTKQQKKQTLKTVKAFVKAKSYPLSFNNIDLKFYHKFDLYLIDQGMAGNTRGKHFKEIKSILREAAERDIPVNPSYLKKAWKVIKEDSESVFLDIIEIRKIFDCKKVLPQDIPHRDIFVMACFVGARHSDWPKINPENEVIENGKSILRYRQMKTGVIVHVPIHSAVKAIWSKYNKMPRVITNQKFNDALKRIAKAAKLGTCIINGQEVEKADYVTTHTARRSFATNAYLSKSLDVHQIMRCTGHKTESSFLKYLKLDGRDYAAMAAESKFFTEDWSLLRKAL